MLLKGPSRYPWEDPHGSMLVVMLWMIAILTLLSVSLGAHVRQKIALADRIDRRNWLCGLAETGVEKAVFRILQKKASQEQYLTLHDSYTSGAGEFGHVTLGEGSFTVGYPYRESYSGKTKFHYGIEDEEGKMNVNLMDAKTLAVFFERAADLDTEQAEEIAYAVADWRDKDDSMSHPEYEAEDDYYEDLEHPYESKDQLFESVEELQMVRGVTPEIYQRLAPLITVYGAGAVNINTASPEVLLGMGMEESLVEKIRYFRSGSDGVEGNADDGSFMSADNLATEFAQRVKASQDEINQLNQLATQGLIGVNSHYFRIHSYGAIPRKEQIIEIDAVVDIKGGIFSWSVGTPRRMTEWERLQIGQKT